MEKANMLAGHPYPLQMSGLSIPKSRFCVLRQQTRYMSENRHGGHRSSTIQVKNQRISLLDIGIPFTQGYRYCL